jgi:hypothetical protein
VPSIQTVADYFKPSVQTGYIRSTFTKGASVDAQTSAYSRWWRPGRNRVGVGSSGGLRGRRREPRKCGLYCGHLGGIFRRRTDSAWR